MRRRTKIITTLGPTSSSPKIIKNLIKYLEKRVQKDREEVEALTPLTETKNGVPK